MEYAIDLSPRQSSRTLEQAVRHQASVELETHMQSDGKPIVCRMESTEALQSAESQARCLAVVLLEGKPIDHYANLVGSYCEVCIKLGDNRYLFSSDVVSLEGPAPADGQIRLYLSRPQKLQIAQRRRFRRIQFAHSSRIELRWIEEDQAIESGIGWLCNISADGLALRTNTNVADRIWIGGELKVEFTLAPGDAERLTFDAVLCSKTPAGTPEKMIIGLQFLSGPGHENSTNSIEALRRQLLDKYATPAKSPDGADK